MTPPIGDGAMLRQFVGGGRPSPQQNQQKVRAMAEAVHDLVATLNRIEVLLVRGVADPTYAESLKEGVREATPVIRELSAKMDESNALLRRIAQGGLVNIAFGAGGRDLLGAFVHETDKLGAVLKKWVGTIEKQRAQTEAPQQEESV